MGPELAVRPLEVASAKHHQQQQQQQQHQQQERQQQQQPSVRRILASIIVHSHQVSQQQLLKKNCFIKILDGSHQDIISSSSVDVTKPNAAYEKKKNVCESTKSIYFDRSP